MRLLQLLTTIIKHIALYVKEDLVKISCQICIKRMIVPSQNRLWPRDSSNEGSPPMFGGAFSHKISRNCHQKTFLSRARLKHIRLTLAMKTAITAVASSGAELPAAMKVAPATSDWMWRTEIKKNIIIILNTSMYKLTIHSSQRSGVLTRGRGFKLHQALSSSSNPRARIGKELPKSSPKNIYKQEMLQYVTNAPEGPFYWPWSLAVTLNTAKEPESFTGHKLSFRFTFLCDLDLGQRTLILIMIYHLIIVYLFIKSN